MSFPNLRSQSQSNLMTIKRTTTSEMFEAGPSNRPQVIRLGQCFSGSSSTCKRKASIWTTEEHEKFLEAMELYPSGPWKKIARHVSTRTPRQVMTHAQKYRQRIQRRNNRTPRKTVKTTNLVHANAIDTPTTSTNEMVELFSVQSADAFELLLHTSICEEVVDDVQGLDFLLLDDVLELNMEYPTTFVDSALDDSELVGILSDSMADHVWS